MTDATSSSIPPFSIARSLPQALAAMASGARPVAGGTDLVVGARQGKQPLPLPLVAIDRLTELATVTDAADGELRIGALMTHGTLMDDRAVIGRATAVADGAALIGSPATRAMGTIGGNVMNGSPAMDTGAPLSVLGAEVELSSMANGGRRLPVDRLWLGPGRTAADQTELCTALILPPRPQRSGSAYVRLEYRRAMEIAVVGAAAAVTLTADDRLAHLAVSLTAVAPTILPVIGLDHLLGGPVDDALVAAVVDLSVDQARPIDDLRAGARYRRHMAGVMAARAVRAAARRAAGDDVAVPVNRAIGIGAAR